MTATMLPCEANWRRFEITGGYVDRVTAPIAQAALDAAVICETACPIFDACLTATMANPPNHRCVQAGLIWEPAGNYMAEPWKPAKWAKKHAPQPPKPNLPDDAPRCEQCGTPFMPYKGKIYCSRICTDRARNARVSAARPTHCPHCQERLPGNDTARRLHIQTHVKQLQHATTEPDTVPEEAMAA